MLHQVRNTKICINSNTLLQICIVPSISTEIKHLSFLFLKCWIMYFIFSRLLSIIILLKPDHSGLKISWNEMIFLHFWKLRFLCKIFQKIFSGNWFLFISQIFLVRTIFYFLTCRMLLLWQQKPISDCTKTNIFLNAQQNCLMTLFWRESSIFSSIYCVVFFSFFILSEKRIVSFFLCSGANLLI